MERNIETDKFKYRDFIRSASRSISEEKQEIRSNIANHEMDKKVEELVEAYFNEKQIDFTGLNRNCIVAKIGWNKELKTAVLVDVGFYKK